MAIPAKGLGEDAVGCLLQERADSFIPSVPLFRTSKHTGKRSTNAEEQARRPRARPTNRKCACTLCSLRIAYDSICDPVRNRSREGAAVGISTTKGKGHIRSEC